MQDELDSEVFLVLDAGWIRDTVERLIRGGHNSLESRVTAHYG